MRYYMSVPERQEAIEKLREVLKPGDTLYTILRQVSRSGMSRHISVVKIGEDRQPWEISHLIARAMDMRRNLDDGGIIITGAEMDMGIIYNLGRTLYPDGFPCTGGSSGAKQCRSNEHTNGDRHYAKHTHKNGGYAFNQVWI